jgi:hypothetical protein
LAAFGQCPQDSESGKVRPIFPAMLSMRKKPPADFPDINAGDPWSETDLADLDELLSDGMPVAEIASYLCRTVEEVERKIRN